MPLYIVYKERIEDHTYEMNEWEVGDKHDETNGVYSHNVLSGLCQFLQVL